MTNRKAIYEVINKESILLSNLLIKHYIIVKFINKLSAFKVGDNYKGSNHFKKDIYFDTDRFKIVCYVFHLIRRLH